MTDLNPSVVLIAPNEAHCRSLRRALEAQRTTILREYNIYPSYAHLPQVLEADCDAFVVEIDTDMDLAMDLVEAICARKPAATVMVYSEAPSPDRMVRAMRAGSREYLSGVVAPAVLLEALERAAARRAESAVKKVDGKVMVFWGSKGGSGVTTLAANFAIALRMETAAEVALLDLNPDLGDVALLLGVTPRFTVVDALQNTKRLDQDFISTLMTEHPSGVSVLAAPETYGPAAPSESRDVERLAEVFRNQYPWVVVDAGRGLGSSADALFQMASTIYLVTQLDIPSLRNTQRFISYVQRTTDRPIEVVVNRFDPRRTEFNDERVSKAVGQSPKWKIPNDFGAVHHSVNTGSPLILDKSPVSHVLKAMARAATGRPVLEEKRRSWNLFG
jgi:pilus assembly protein CpaE